MTHSHANISQVVRIKMGGYEGGVKEKRQWHDSFNCDMTDSHVNTTSWGVQGPQKKNRHTHTLSLPLSICVSLSLFPLLISLPCTHTLSISSPFLSFALSFFLCLSLALSLSNTMNMRICHTYMWRTHTQKRRIRTHKRDVFAHTKEAYSHTQKRRIRTHKRDLFTHTKDVLG